jgi:adenine-specific DNA-methyltransferase
LYWGWPKDFLGPRMPVLNWIGKDKVINHHLDLPFRTLLPKYNFGDEEAAKDNLIIHGDNLEARKALLPQYKGQVKLIYIDPLLLFPPRLRASA